jgi:tetratricopeptide (TPR) repeat protein
MGMRFRKSMKLGPGVRLNVSKTGVGISAGVKGARYSVHSSGRKTTSVRVPGTGVYYMQQKGGGSRGGRRAAAPTPQAVSVPSPGLMAPKYEKRFAEAVRRYAVGDTAGALPLFIEASTLDTANKALSDDFFAGILLAQSNSTALAIPYLEKVAASPQGLPDALMTKYVGGALISVPVTPQLAVTVQMGSLAAVLVLVECYQEQGRIDEAIGLLQQLIGVASDKALIVSLCELLSLQGAWDEVIDLATGHSNADDVDLQILIYQGVALTNIGRDDAALVVYREALKSKKRDCDLLWWARYNRAMIHLRDGKKARAKNDFAAIYAENRQYADVAQQLAALDQLVQ